MGRKDREHKKKPQDRLPLTVEENKRLADLIALRQTLVSRREAAKGAKKAADDKIKRYKEAVKNDENGFYHRIDDHWESHGKSKGAYHGGAWNGKDSRDAMSNPERYYGTMKRLLYDVINRSSKSAVKRLLRKVCRLLRSWHDVFHNLRSEERTWSQYEELDKQIKKAVHLHRRMGLPITPKVHILEDHGRKKREEMDEMDITFFFTIEDFVEHNHELGNTQEERVKRVHNANVRAKLQPHIDTPIVFLTEKHFLGKTLFN